MFRSDKVDGLETRVYCIWVISNMTQSKQQLLKAVLYPPPLCRVGRPLNLRFKVGALWFL